MGGHIVSTYPIHIDDLEEYPPAIDNPQFNSPIKDTLSLLTNVTVHSLFSTGCVEEEDKTPLETGNFD